MVHGILCLVLKLMYLIICLIGRLRQCNGHIYHLECQKDILLHEFLPQKFSLAEAELLKNDFYKFSSRYQQIETFRRY